MRGLEFFQTFNSLAGALTLLYIYRLMKSIFKNPSASFTAAFFYGSTFGFWHHSTDANIYILFNLVITVIFCRFLLDREFNKTSHLLATALLAVFATLIHQLGVFLLIPVTFYLISKTKDKKPDFKAAGFFIAVYIAGILVPYLLVYNIVIKGSESEMTFIRWITAYGSNRNFWPILYHDLPYCIDIISRSQFQAFFHIKPLEIIVHDGLQTGEGESMKNLFSFTLALILMLVIERIHFINFRAKPDERILYRKVLYWFFPFFLFFWFFAPENYFYRILYLAPLLIFGSGLIASSTFRDRKNIKPFIFILAIFTFVFNAWTGIIPESRLKGNPYIRDAQSLALHEEISSDDLVVFGDRERYLAAVYRYYFNRDCLLAMSQPRYRNLTPGEIESAKSETVDFLTEKYRYIIFSSTAREMGVMTYFFSLNNFPQPRPDIMLVDKDQLVQRNVIQTNIGSYFEMALEKPLHRRETSQKVLIQGSRETLQPVR
jgi:hypothetical protein